MANYDDLEAIAEIIGLTEKQRSPDIYARMIQYQDLRKTEKIE
jgi:hypothetical protein